MMSPGHDAAIALMNSLHLVHKTCTRTSQDSPAEAQIRFSGLQKNEKRGQEWRWKMEEL